MVSLSSHCWIEVNIHTHKGPCESLCSFIEPLSKIQAPFTPQYFILKNLLENISSVITMAIFTHICVFNFSILLPVGSQKCSLVLYTLKHGVAHNPTLCYGHLNFVPVSLFMAEHTWHLILTLHKPASAVHWVKSFWLAHGWGLTSLSCGLWSRNPSCLFY